MDTSTITQNPITGSACEMVARIIHELGQINDKREAKRLLTVEEKIRILRGVIATTMKSVEISSLGSKYLADWLEDYYKKIGKNIYSDCRDLVKNGGGNSTKKVIPLLTIRKQDAPVHSSIRMESDFFESVALRGTKVARYAVEIWFYLSEEGEIIYFERHRRMVDGQDQPVHEINMGIADDAYLYKILVSHYPYFGWILSSFYETLSTSIRRAQKRVNQRIEARAHLKLVLDSAGIQLDEK